MAARRSEARLPHKRLQEHDHYAILNVQHSCTRMAPSGVLLCVTFIQCPCNSRRALPVVLAIWSCWVGRLIRV